MNEHRIEDCFIFMAISVAIVHHKLQWIDKIFRDWRGECECEPNLIFITHSIGAYIAQSLLLRRRDIQAKVKQIIHLMPFIRFDPPPMKKRLLSSAAYAQKYTIPMMTALTRVLTTALPRNWVDSYLKQMGMDCKRGREIAIDIFMNPNMVRNHLVLGMQELRGEILPSTTEYLLRNISNENLLCVTCINRRVARIFKCKIKIIFVHHNVAFNHVRAYWN
jgi:hypothetical protein